MTEIARRLLVVIAIFGSALCFAMTGNSKPVAKSVIDKYAAEYFAYESVASLFSVGSRRALHHCDDDDGAGTGKSCVDAACERVGRYNCDELSELERIGKACRGNRNGVCIETACNQVGRYNCDELSEIERLAAACKGNYDSSCVEAACNSVGRYNCDELSELERIGQACRGAEGSCVESVCGRIGRYNCDEISEIERVASSCGGD